MKATAGLLFVLEASLACPAGAAPPKSQPLPVIEEGSRAVDGSASLTPNNSNWVSMVLFDGVTPPHGFQVQLQEAQGCPLYISDVGPFVGSPGSAFLVALSPGTSLADAPTIYTTPPGYRPIGPVYVGTGAGCGTSPILFAARMW
jgi:hypothetical protein